MAQPNADMSADTSFPRAASKAFTLTHRPRLVLRPLKKPSPLSQVTNMDEGDTIEVDTKQKGKLPRPSLQTRVRRASGTADRRIELHDHTLEDDKENADDDRHSVITISSEPDRGEDEAMTLSDRPWRQQKWSIEVRKQFEYIFRHMHQRPMDNSWEYTELYSRELDAQMHKYLEDFPPSRWAIGPQEGEVAFHKLTGRDRWRTMGVSVVAGSNGAIFLPQQQHNASPAPQFINGPGVPQGDMQFHPGQMSQQAQYAPSLNGLQPPFQAPNGHHPYGNGFYAQAPAPAPAPAPAQAPAPVPQPQQPGPKRKTTSRKASAAIHVTTGQLEQPDTVSPAVQAPPPPYPVRPKPAEKKPPNKTTGKQARKQAEADVFPWNRKLDFAKERAIATWDMSKYDPKILQEMQETRERNATYITEQDDNSTEKQRQSRLDKTRRVGESADGSDSDTKAKAGRSTPRPKKCEDNSQAGNFGFAGADDKKRALASKCKTPEEVITAAEAGTISLDQCKTIMICWHPDKKGKSEYLEQACYRVYDTLITRQQMAERPVWTRSAAECIIDFCPDLLWRETLLRIQCEGGLGNKEIRNRYTSNGCWTDNSTFTKRLLAALGQKQSAPQTQSKKVTAKAGKEDESDGNVGTGPKKAGQQAGRYGPGELEWLMANQEDHVAYAAFFGKSITNRANAKVKRGAPTDNENDLSPPTKRRRGSQESDESRPQMRSGQTSGWNAVNRLDVEDDGAVSAQDSDVLDSMDVD